MIRRKSDGLWMILKRFFNEESAEEEKPALKVQLSLKHPHILSTDDIFYDNSGDKPQLCYINPIIKTGDLQDYIDFKMETIDPKWDQRHHTDEQIFKILT